VEEGAWISPYEKEDPEIPAQLSRLKRVTVLSAGILGVE
jgi:hypothetical protein